MAKEYYFISDLHIGGDSYLDICDFEKELIDFLKKLEKNSNDAELVIVGDVFGMWEITTVPGKEKLNLIIQNHIALFEQFKRTGDKITITIIPGNHDHELACYDESVAILKDYNIKLEPEIYITRTIGNKKIWIEHGCQHDEFNSISKFGDPDVTPLGYYVTTRIVTTATKYSDFGKSKWLKDVESVYPKEHAPHWVYSNYYYREMNFLLRLAVLPFLVFFGVSLLVLIFYLLDRYGITQENLLNYYLLSHLGMVGDVINVVFTVNTTIITLLLIASPFIYLLYRDVRNTLTRYSLISKDNLKKEKEENYIKAAKEIFVREKDVAIFVYGHTHSASVKKIDGKVIINTGTWLKKLQRVNTRFKLLPDVYYPSFKLSYFKVYKKEKDIIIEYHSIQKKIKTNLTLLQYLLVFGKEKDDSIHIPKKTIISNEK